MTACPPLETLSRELVEPSAELQQHLGHCSHCGRAFSELRALRAAAPALPYTPPSAAEVQQGEQALLQAARQRSKGGSKLIPRAAALAAAGLLGFALAEGLRPFTETAPKSGSAPVLAEAAPELPEPASPSPETTTRQKKDAAPALAELDEGSLSFELPDLAPSQSPWMRLADVKLSGPKAKVRATVVGGQLAQLEVLSGQLKLRIEGQEVELKPGTPWRRGVQATAAELAFVDGQSRWERSDFAGANQAFAQALAQGARGSMAEEARYGQARVLFELERPDAARQILQDLVDNHPSGQRVASAHLELAEHAVAQGRLKTAREHLQAVRRLGTNAERRAAKSRLRQLRR